MVLSYVVIVFWRSLSFVHSISPRDIACLAASAWPKMPPPLTVTVMSILSLALPASISGSVIFSFASSGFTLSSGLLFIVILPFPGFRVARAIAHFLLPIVFIIFAFVLCGLSMLSLFITWLRAICLSVLLWYISGFEVWFCRLFRVLRVRR